MVINRPGLTLINGLPAGDRLVSGPYAATDHFVASFFERVERARLIEPSTPDRMLTGPIELEPEGQSEGQHLTMESCGVTARARMADGKLWVLAGSHVRLDPVPSVGSAALKDREDLLHDGGLVREGNHLVLTEDVGFDTPSATTNIVAGSRVKPELWRPVAEAQDIDPKS